MNSTKRIEFTALWNGYLNGHNISCVTKFVMELESGSKYNLVAIEYLKSCALTLGVTDFFVKEIVYDVG